MAPIHIWPYKLPYMVSIERLAKIKIIFRKFKLIPLARTWIVYLIFCLKIHIFKFVLLYMLPATNRIKVYLNIHSFLGHCNHPISISFVCLMTWKCLQIYLSWKTNLQDQTSTKYFTIEMNKYLISFDYPCHHENIIQIHKVQLVRTNIQKKFKNIKKKLQDYIYSAKS